MTTAVANHATERGRAPGSRPGPEGRLAAAALSGVALGAGLRHDRLAPALGPRPDRLGRRRRAPARSAPPRPPRPRPPCGPGPPCAARSCTGSSGACTSGRGRPSGWAGPGSRRPAPRAPRSRTSSSRCSGAASVVVASVVMVSISFLAQRPNEAASASLSSGPASRAEASAAYIASVNSRARQPVERRVLEAHPGLDVARVDVLRPLGDVPLVEGPPGHLAHRRLRHRGASLRSHTPIWRDAVIHHAAGATMQGRRSASRPMTTKTPRRRGPDRGLAQPDHRLRRGGARPAPRQPGELADPPEGAAGRPRRRARPGRLGPAGPRQPAHRLRRRRPRPGRARAQPRRADRAGPVRRPRPRRGGARPRDPRPDRRDGRARTTRSSAPSWRTSRSTTPGSSPCSATSPATIRRPASPTPTRCPSRPRSPTSSRASSTCSATTASSAATRRAPTDVARLLDGAAPTLLATDPPYGVQLDQTWRDGVYNGPRKRVERLGRRRGRREAVHDARRCRRPARRRRRPTGDPWPPHRGPPQHLDQRDTRADWSEAFALVPSLQVGYVWYASVHTLEVLQGLLDIGFELASQIIWDKGLFSIGRSWYHWAHEPCCRGPQAGRAEPLHRRARPGDDLAGALPQADRRRQQGAQGGPPDPEAGASSPRSRSATTSRPGEAVYEPVQRAPARRSWRPRPWAGAATRWRSTRKYVQVAIERWQNFTGRTAERVDG